MGALFECECDWSLDRDVNASIDLLQTAVSKRLEMAGGLWFSPGAFRHDAMMILYEPAMAARSEPNGMSEEEAVP
jgi:transposase